MTAVLRISDGTTTINLLNATDGFSLNAWRPAIAQYKGGGTWQASPLSDGRRMVTRQHGNAVEAFDLKVSSVASQDDIIFVTQELRRLLEKAVNYWTTDWQGEKVWVEAQATCETNPRYATIHSWSTPDDDNPFSSPFLQPRGAIMDDWTLVVERGHWQSTIPGTGDCVEISGLGIGNESQSFYPTANTDDAYVIPWLTTIVTTGITCLMGTNPSTFAFHSGIRFRDVTITNGTTITGAFIRFTCGQSQSGTDCNLAIFGEDNAAPAAFTTFADFTGRTRTGTSQVWNNVPAWTAGAEYDSVDISAIVQEIVDLGGWASGNDLVIFMQDNGSDPGGIRAFAAFDNTVYDEAELIITTQVTQVGRVATCDQEVYVANKHNKAQLTHIYRDDGGAWSANLVALTDFDLLPAGPALDDAIYFGSDTTTADSGPFCSLVFDLDDVKTQSAIWEYWNGGAWHAFTATELCDNTAPDEFNGDAFEIAGVNSVHWIQMADWAIRDISGDGGPAVTGYWVRCRADAATGGVPTQQNRAVYSILWPYVTIDEEQSIGDIPSIAEIQYEPKSKTTNQNVTATTTPLWSNKTLMGLRSLNRGENFSPFINLQDEQNPEGITITLATSATNVVDVTTATGRHSLYSPAGINAMQEEIRIGFTRDAALQYYGTYRMMVRGRQSSGALDTLYMQIEHKVNTYVTLKWSPIRQFTSTTLDWQIIDFGQWQLPGFTDVNDDEGVTGLELVINCQSTSGTPGDLIFYELILWPIDEWAVETFDVSLDGVQGWVGGDRGTGRTWRYLSVDSLGYPKRVLRSISKISDTDIRSVWRPITNGPAILQANADQRLWFLSLRNDDVGSLPEYQYHSEPYVGSTILVKKSQRYLSMRGSR